MWQGMIATPTLFFQVNYLLKTRRPRYYSGLSYSPPPQIPHFPDVWSRAWWSEYAGSSAFAEHSQSSDQAYLRADSLFALLEGTREKPAPVKLLRGSWLLKRARLLQSAQDDKERRERALPRRQDLEAWCPEAFLSAQEVQSLRRGHVGEDFEHCGGCCCTCCNLPSLGGYLFERPPEGWQLDRPLKLISISHAWLTPKHPDPFGHQLVRFAEQVHHERSMCPGSGEDVCVGGVDLCRHVCMSAAYLGGCLHGCFCGLPYMGQQCGRTAQQFASGEFAVFYDFCSLMQKDGHGERSTVEAAAFSTALESMGLWYAAHTASTACNRLPMPSAQLLLRLQPSHRYAHRLTTTYAMSTLPAGWDHVTPYVQRGWTTFELAVSGMIKRSSFTSWRKVVNITISREREAVASSYRQPPFHPQAFAALLAQKTFTNGKSDCLMVSQLYADTLVGSFGRVESLEFAWCEWGDKEVVQLADALALAFSATSLNLMGNEEVGRRGYNALAQAIKAGSAPKLKSVWVHSESNRSDDLRVLKVACEERGIALQK